VAGKFAFIGHVVVDLALVEGVSGVLVVFSVGVGDYQSYWVL
jgi:hypothetical protein